MTDKKHSTILPDIFMHRKDDTFRMDPSYILLFLGFGLIFGIAGTLIVYATQYLPIDRRAAGLGVFLCGCAAKYYYGLQMPPTPFVPIPPLTTAAGFLIHPLFFAAGILVISGFSRYISCLRKEMVFSAAFFTGGFSAVLGGLGFYTALSSLTAGTDFAIIPSLIGGFIETCIAAVLFVSVYEAYTLLQKRQTPPAREMR